MSQPALFMAVLDNGSGAIRSQFLNSWLHGFAGRNLHVELISDSHPGRGRNRAAMQFLASKCEYLLFIDGDIVFSRAHVDRIYSHDNTHKVVVGGYPLKCVEPTLCAMFAKDASVNESGLIPVLRAGTGFMRIHRDAFEALKAKSPFFTMPMEGWDFFSSGVEWNADHGKAEWLSEDWSFCDKVSRAGMLVELDPDIMLRHEGNILYPLDPPKPQEPIADVTITADDETDSIKMEVQPRSDLIAVFEKPLMELASYPTCKTCKHWDDGAPNKDWEWCIGETEAPHGRCMHSMIEDKSLARLKPDGIYSQRHLSGRLYQRHP